MKDKIKYRQGLNGIPADVGAQSTASTDACSALPVLADEG
jgi:hypothetical protein